MKRKEQHDILKTLQKYYDVVMIWHPSDPDDFRVFLPTEFTPKQFDMTGHTLVGRDITELMNDNCIPMNFNKNSFVSKESVERQTFETQFDAIPVRRYQFSPEHAWQWYFASI